MKKTYEVPAVEVINFTVEEKLMNGPGGGAGQGSTGSDEDFEW